MHRGFVLIYRKLIDSRVFRNEGLLKVWIWCLLKANHAMAWVSIKTGRGTTEVKVEPGQFIFGRHSAAKELSMPPSSVRNRMKKLKSLGNLDIKEDKQYSLVSIINWDTYQDFIKKEDSKEDSRRTAVGQPKDTNNNDNNDKNDNSINTPEETSSLTPSGNPPDLSAEIEKRLERYPDAKTVEHVFEVLATTRKTGRISESIVLAQLQKWERYRVEQVMGGIHTYIDKDYAGDGKAENYLYGIIRNWKPGRDQGRDQDAPDRLQSQLDYLDRLDAGAHE